MTEARTRRSPRRPTLEGLFFFAFTHASCAVKFDAPREHVADARFGKAPRDFDPSRACGNWDGSFESDPEARVHHSFAERSPASCFVEVIYSGENPRVGEVPAECGYPSEDSVATLEGRAAVYEATASRRSRSVPLELACDLDESTLARAAKNNASTMRATARVLHESKRFPYALVGTFGFGSSDHDASALVGWKPGDACRDIDDRDRALLGINQARASRAARAFHAGVAPMISVSGGAVHSSLNESFMLTHLLVCDLGVPRDRVLVDPCADHTHTNIRNTGAIVIGVGGRTAYLLTDDTLQSDYLQEWTLFDLIGGSIDQRAKRDWGFLIGAWRQASRGMKAGFWYSPYRFWAEDPGGLGSFACVGDVRTGAPD